MSIYDNKLKMTHTHARARSRRAHKTELSKWNDRLDGSVAIDDVQAD